MVRQSGKGQAAPPPYNCIIKIATFQNIINQIGYNGLKLNLVPYIRATSIVKLEKGKAIKEKEVGKGQASCYSCPHGFAITSPLGFIVAANCSTAS